MKKLFWYKVSLQSLYTLVFHNLHTWEGFITIEQTQLNVYAGNAPNATMKYEYSAPDDGIIVPNSAYESAPITEIMKMFLLL